MPNQMVEILLKSGGPWAAALGLVCWFFIRELRKRDAKIVEFETLHKTLISAHAQQVKDLNEKLQQSQKDLNEKLQQSQKDLNEKLQQSQAEQFQSRLKENEAFRKVYAERQQDILSALTASTQATEENSKMLERLEDFLKPPTRKR
jgi:Skp family chaperone for outer membrane proteins